MKQCLPNREEKLPCQTNLGQLCLARRLLFISLFSFLSFFAFSQQRVTGKVAACDSALAGDKVQVKGGSVATQTDAEGNFSIDAPANGTLVVSSIGFAPQEVKVSSSGRLFVQLKSDVQQMSDVVVVGYGVQRKATLTGSVSQVSGAEVTKSPSPNVANSLQGRLPGLTANQRNGTPGRDNPQILIRGTGSVPPPGADFNALLNLNAHLVIIDGVPRDDFGRLNPDDIESFSVLKDGSAAIYGARAANGVILITTKTGSRGKADFTFSYNHAINRPTKVPDMLDAANFAEVYNEGVFYRSARNPNYTPQYTPDQIQKMRDGSDPILNPNTDWVGLTL